MSEAKTKDGCGCSVGGFGIGTVIAVVVSWSLYHSILWAAIHGFFGWFYVIYYLITHKG
jgi:hypothetical protein